MTTMRRNQTNLLLLGVFLQVWVWVWRVSSLDWPFPLPRLAVAPRNLRRRHRPSASESDHQNQEFECPTKRREKTRQDDSIADRVQPYAIEEIVSGTGWPFAFFLIFAFAGHVRIHESGTH